MADKGRYALVTDAVMPIWSDITYGPRLTNCWLPASTWVEALRKSDLIDASLSISIDVRKFNTATTSKSTKWCTVLLDWILWECSGSYSTTSYTTTALKNWDKSGTHILSTVHGRKGCLKPRQVCFSFQVQGQELLTTWWWQHMSTRKPQ